MAHHDLPLHEVVLLLGVDRRAGLDETEAALRLERFGPNELPVARPVSVWLRLLRQVHNPLVYVLIVAGVVTVFLGEHVDASVILGVVIVNTLIGAPGWWSPPAPAPSSARFTGWWARRGLWPPP